MLLSNSSELRGNPQSAAFQERIETSGPPDPEEGRQGHCAAACSRTGASADVTADHQVAQAPCRGVVIRGSLRVGNEDAQYLDVPLHPPAQCPLDSQGVFPERLTQLEPPRLQDPLRPQGTAAGRRPTHALGVEPVPPDRPASSGYHTCSL